MKFGAVGTITHHLLLAALLLVSLSAGAASISDFPQVKTMFPEADSFGPFEGEPVAAKALKGDELVGYVLLTNDIAPVPAYSGKPINHLVGIDMAGKIRGAYVIEHHEPIMLAGIPEERLHRFAAQYVEKHVSDRIRVGSGTREGFVNLDGVSGATVTVIVQNEAIMRSVRQLAVAHGIIKSDPALAQPRARVKMDNYEPSSWEFLTGNGAIRRMHVTYGDVDAAFVGTPGEGIDEASAETKGDTFIDMYYAYLNSPIVGRNLLGDREYHWLMTQLGENEHAIAVMANGNYSFRGTGFVRGGIFDRFQLWQNDRGISFRDMDYHHPTALGQPLTDMPGFGESVIFIIRNEHEFDPGQPWQAELLVVRQTTPLERSYVSFSGDYLIPDAYVEYPPAPVIEAEVDEPIWVTIWRDKSFQIVVLVTALGVLSMILMFQEWLVKRPRLLNRLRTGFLLFTLFYIGWYSLAQLSVVNVLTFTYSIINGFRWDTFLMDPLMFILWTFVAVSVLLVGRGIYCGWLCPFGALQEFINRIARYFKVRQLEFPAAVHERLWAIKYIILIVLFGISLQSLASAERYAEVEPFKTAIILHFQREWGYLLYAGALLLIGAFNHKFYCRYVCPLGAALAVVGKIRLFEWLHRRKECGRPCQICANECEVRAIDRIGVINMNECHYCLDCQVTYHDQHKCPPLVERVKRRERAEQAKQS
ncbi:MAG: NosR/NirI family protein [Gammaproteobacteria bacterium]|nr:NosR/NirI family protein [Gammaproteobacteria bacterium]